MSSIFTKIINREIPAAIVYEDDECVAFRDIDPKAPVHILLVPKKEIPSLAEVTAEDKSLLGHLLLKASEIAKAEGISDSGYRIVINTNKEGGQEVYHVHMHVLGGRQMTWPPG
ncbi:MAG TPA: histidine triad nucleotide-binding protein [Thermodesulfobacteriota bacterium]|nr:histidine triad nucleotide-binding protein [Thermodesulfobacteriota bacterium]